MLYNTVVIAIKVIMRINKELSAILVLTSVKLVFNTIIA
jgi:hypothetical protein